MTESVARMLQGTAMRTSVGMISPGLVDTSCPICTIPQRVLYEMQDGRAIGRSAAQVKALNLGAYLVSVAAGGRSETIWAPVVGEME